MVFPAGLGSIFLEITQTFPSPRQARGRLWAYHLPPPSGTWVVWGKPGRRAEFGSSANSKASAGLRDRGANSVVARFDVWWMRSLAPLVKTRGFGMTPLEARAKPTHYANSIAFPANSGLRLGLWRGRRRSRSRVLFPSSTRKTRKRWPPLMKECGTPRLAGPSRRRKRASGYPSGLPHPLHAKGAERSGRNYRLPLARAHLCRPSDSVPFSLRLPRTYVLGYRLPPFRGWGDLGRRSARP